MTPASLPCLVAHALDGVPGILLGVPIVAVASFVFAATRHEDPAVIRRVTLQWIMWMGGILGGVLVAVRLLAWLA